MFHGALPGHGLQLRVLWQLLGREGQATPPCRLAATPLQGGDLLCQLGQLALYLCNGAAHRLSVALGSLQSLLLRYNCLATAHDSVLRLRRPRAVLVHRLGEVGHGPLCCRAPAFAGCVLRLTRLHLLRCRCLVSLSLAQLLAQAGNVPRPLAQVALDVEQLPQETLQAQVCQLLLCFQVRLCLGFVRFQCCFLSLDTLALGTLEGVLLMQRSTLSLQRITFFPVCWSVCVGVQAFEYRGRDSCRACSWRFAAART